MAKDVNYQKIEVSGIIYGYVYFDLAYDRRETILYCPSDSEGSEFGETATSFAQAIVNSGRHCLIVRYPRTKQDGHNIVALPDAIRASEIAIEHQYAYNNEPLVAAIGSSFGGSVLLAQPDVVKRLQAVVLKSPASNLIAGYFNEHGAETLRDWANRQNDDGLSRALWGATKSLYNYSFDITTPMLIFHGTSDVIVPHSQSEILSAILPNSRLRSLLGCDHRFSRAQDRQILYEEAELFLNETLAN